METESLSKDTAVEIYLMRGRGYSWSEITSKLRIKSKVLFHPDRRPDPDPFYFFTSEPRIPQDTLAFLNCEPSNLAAELRRLGSIGVNPRRLPGGKYFMQPPAMTFDQDDYYSFQINDVGYMGIVSDMHFGSKHAKPEALAEFYNICYNEYGITTFLNAGDWCDGNGRVYKGQAYQLRDFGFDAQLGRLAEEYPCIPGCITYGIEGNHDQSWFIADGIHMMKRVQIERPDLVWMGDYHASLLINDTRVYMIHPAGGQPYALSYRGQRLLESIEADLVPDMFLIGHLHSFVNFRMRGTEVFQLLSFMGHNDLSRRKGWENQVGGLIVNMKAFANGVLDYRRVIF